MNTIETIAVGLILFGFAGWITFSWWYMVPAILVVIGSPLRRTGRIQYTDTKG